MRLTEASITNLTILSEQPERVVYSISELNQMVRSLLEDALPPLWVEGEISNYSAHGSGHWYFTLKDANAQLSCAMFAGRNRSVNFRPQNGMHVVVRGKISLYEVSGRYQMIADYMEEAGHGALQRAFEQLKARLDKEGLFDSAYKKTLPAFPKQIGVITSPTGAAIRDIITVLNRRFANIPIIVYPTSVQGAAAAPQIVQALQLANERKECDVLIVGRGGGSLEDLWAFNEEIVARAIFASKIPIISAVGHEIDFTIADFVADQRAPTPSAAAELVSPEQNDLQQQIAKLDYSLTRVIQNKLHYFEHALINLTKRLRSPAQRIQDQAQRIDELEQRLQRTMKINFTNHQHYLENVGRALHAVSPLSTLGRGYAIVTRRENSEIIRSNTQTASGDKIITRLAEGQLLCTVDQSIGHNN